jgi:4-aminobutyrate aminotransferase-like enzyme
MRIWHTNPFEAVTFTRGEGCWVFDASRRAYLDLLSGTWCNVLGHGHPRLKEAVSTQVSTLTHVGAPFLTREIEEALGKLSEILPPALNRAVLLNTGSEAVELALKMARAATGAREVVVVERSYYGATICALSLSEAGRSATYLPSPGTFHRLPVPECARCPVGHTRPCAEGFPCLDKLEALAEAVERGDRKVAAVLFEPVLANGGVIVPPNGYGGRLRALATRGGALLIAEEVTTGMGRTGRWFAFEHEGIVPDILVIGKAIGAGLPVAIVVTTEDVEARCQGVFTHVQSHQNDPLSGRVASTVISVIQEERLVERVAERGRYLLEGLSELRAQARSILEVRGRGLMIGIELRPEWSEKGPGMARRLLELGFIVNYQPHNRAFRLFPPYVISTSEIDAFLEAFRTVLAETEGRSEVGAGKAAVPRALAHAGGDS